MPFCFQFFARTGYDRREMEREFSHLVEKRRPNRGGAPPVGQCRMLRVLRLHSALSCRAARGDTAASAAPAWSNRAAVLGNLCATEECCWERSLTPGFLQRVRGELLQTFKQHGHGVRCNRVRGAAARRQRGDLAALSRPPPLEFPLELPLLPAVPRPPRVPHRAPSAATKSKKQRH